MRPLSSSGRCETRGEVRTQTRPEVLPGSHRTAPRPLLGRIRRKLHSAKVKKATQAAHAETWGQPLRRAVIRRGSHRKRGASAPCQSTTLPLECRSTRAPGVGPGLTFVWLFTAKMGSNPAPLRGAAGVWALLAVKTTQTSIPGPLPAGPGSSSIPHPRGSTIEGPGVIPSD